MKLAMVIERFDPSAGGAERSTFQIAGELSSRGHDVTIITAVAAEPAIQAGFKVQPMLAGYRTGVRRMLKFSRRARRALTGGDFDVSLSMTTAVPATVLQPRSGTVRETLERNVALRNTKAGRFKKRVAIALSVKQHVLLHLEAATLRDPAVRKILAVGRYVTRQLRDLYHVDEARIELLPNASEMPSVDEHQRRQWRQTVRKAFGVPDDSVAYFFAAHNPRLKGLDSLLEATKVLADGGQNVMILLAGQIGYGVVRQAARLGVRDCVRLIGTTGSMAKLYCAADVTVLPTYYDPASKVVIESLMMGMPAITTSYNGAADMLVPPEAVGSSTDVDCPAGQARGRVIGEPSDIKALAAAMRELADPAERDRCRAAIAGLGEALSMRRHVDRLEAVLVEQVALRADR